MGRHVVVLGPQTVLLPVLCVHSHPEVQEINHNEVVIRKCPPCDPKTTRRECDKSDRAKFEVVREVQ